MKVIINRQEKGEEECASLLVYREDTDIARLRDYLEKERFRGTWLECRREQETHRIHSREILYIESVHEVQKVHTASGIYETRLRLYELEERLPETFVRISRSVILQLDKVSYYKPLMNGLMQAQLIGGEQVYISRQYLKKVRDKIRGEEG